MANRSDRSKIFSGCALALSFLLLSASLLPVLAADNADLDNWIEDTSVEKQVPAKHAESVNAASAQIQAERESTVKAPASASNSGEQYDETAVNDHKKVAQVLPHAPGGAGVPPASTVKPAAPVASSNATSTPLLKGGVTYCVPSGTPLKLKLATIPMPELRGELRDMEGKLNPAQLDQEITAKITEDIYVDDNKVIPEGTIFYGKVSKIYPPRHVGRPGHLELSFSKLKTPDGRAFAFRAEANNFKESTAKTKAQGALIIGEHMAGGAAVGVLVAYKIFGLENTVAMHGYNIAGGAALGAAGGLAWALWRRGDKAVLEPGDEFAMSIDKDLLIPAATNPTVKKEKAVSLPGFDVEVLSKKMIKDGFGGHMMRLEAIITNHMPHKKMSSIDLFIQDDLDHRYPVVPDEAEDSQDLFTIDPLSRQKITCCFGVEFPKLKHKLVWLDHHSRSVIFEQKLY